MRPYREIDGKKLSIAQPKWLQNDYIKFFGKYEQRLRLLPIGAVCFITDHSYLDGETFTGFRHALVDKHSLVNVIDLHGDLNRRVERGVELGDEGVFDIVQGTCVTLVGRGLSKNISKGGELLMPRSKKYSMMETNLIGDFLAYDLDTESYPYRFLKRREKNPRYSQYQELSLIHI